MAPEVLEKGCAALSSAADVYALGMTIYQLVTHGKQPFREVSLRS